MRTRFSICLAVMMALGLAAPGMPLQSGQEPSLPPSLASIHDLIEHGSYSEAAVAARQLLTNTVASHGSESVEAALVLDALVDALYQGDAENESELVELAQRAVHIKEQRLGPDHAEVATSLGLLGNVYRRLHQFEDARTAHTRALAILEGGSKGPGVAQASVNLATTLTEMGSYEEALPLFESDLTISRMHLSDTDPQLGRKLYNLARLYKRMGRYAQADSSYRRALANVEANFGHVHPGVVYNLNGLGALKDELGEYAEALELYRDALAVAESTLGPRHSLTTALRNNIGLVYRRLGDYSRARDIYERELAALAGAEGSDAVDRGVILGNLADTELLAGNNDRALALSTQALDIVRGALGDNHVRTANRLFAHASIQFAVENYDTAEQCLRQALSIRTTTLGPNHHDVAGTLTALARVEHMVGRHDEECIHLRNALSIYERSFGPNHPELAGVCLRLASSLLETQGGEECFDLALRAEQIASDRIRLTSRTLPEQSALRYSAVQEGGLSLALDIIAGAGSTASAEMRSRAYATLIRSRAMVLDEMAARHRMLAETDAPTVAKLFELLRERSQFLAHLLVRGPDAHDPGRYATEVREAQEARLQAEADLATKSSAYRERLAQVNVGMKEVAEQLPPLSALVSFTSYQPAGARTPARRDDTASSRYIAFVLRADSPAPMVVAIGPTAEIDTLIARWMHSVTRGAHDTSSGAEAMCRVAGEALRDRAWQPLRPALGGVERVFIVPEGALNLVSFAALPEGPAQYLADTNLRIHYLSSERDLASVSRDTDEALLVLGDPDFDAPHANDPQAGSGTAPPRSVAAFRGSIPDCEAFESAQFRRLGGAKQEATDIATLWTASRPRASITHVSDSQATEALFKDKASGSTVIHLATHGFFVGSCARPGQRAVQGLAVSSDPDVLPAASDNPLILSGLALAGANHRRTARPDEEDGILTGEEIAALDLGRAQWAVLSACGTGVGRIEAGEGVFGLRRAFRIAGVRTLIMSLWSVSDEPTRAWMVALYNGRLVARKNTADAVWQANHDVLTQLREHGKSTHPFRWASFVAAGDWH